MRDDANGTTAYEHHGLLVHADAHMKDRHREHNLCFKCEHFKPHTDEHCEIALAVADHNRRFYTITPMVECPEFLARTRTSIATRR